ncbi:MAG: response regulator [Phycisphaerae bacterium]|jgi:two-component system chemotaxis response regulator CheY|nr:response regulator [Phycisphaerae bacterium]
MAQRILTVDDSPTMRRMIEMTVKTGGYEVVEAADGQAALELLKNCSVDLVISDINMPNLNGIELTRQLRANPKFSKTPIILLTTESDPEKKQEGKAAGATGWIVKPFKQDQLLAVVSKVLPAAA